MRTPSELKGWNSELELLLPELREHLKGWLNPLLRWLAPRAWQAGPEGEPDGWDGLTQQRVTSRLLPAEWALARAAPLEFLRRAAEHELLHWQLARQSPRPSGRLRLLFNCGPTMLGAPRLVQLALLLVWGRLTRERGQPLLLFSPECLERPSPGVSREALQHFLEWRTASLPDPAVLQQFSQQAEPGDESWWISDTRQAQLATLCIRQLDSQTVELDMEGRRLELKLPAGPRAVHLLRTPGSFHDPLQHRDLVNAQGLLLLGRAQRLAALEPDALLLLPVPSGPRQPGGRLRRVPFPYATGPVLGVGEVRQSLVALTVLDDAHWQLLSLTGRPLPEAWLAPQRSPAEVPHPGCGLVWESREQLWLHADDQLFSLGDAGWSRVATARLFQWRSDGAIWLLEGEPGAPQEGTQRLLRLTGGEAREVWSEKVEGGLPLLGNFLRDGRGPLSARRTEHGSWCVRDDQLNVQTRLPVDVERPIGLFSSHRWSGAALAWCESQVLHLQSRDWAQRVPFPRDVQTVALSPYRAAFAYRTLQEVGVYSLDHGAFLTRVRL